MSKENGFKSETTKATKTPKAATTTTKAKAVTVRKKWAGDFTKIAIPRNPREAFELGLLMAKYQ